MPLYEYVCRACHRDFEALVPASRRDDGTASCPQCGAARLARKISLAAHPVTGQSADTAGAWDCGAPGGCCGGACELEN